MSATAVYTGQAPGRLDVMGGISDYSGGLVLQQALNEYTTVSFKASVDGLCRLESRLPGEHLTAELVFSELLQGGVIDYEFARKFFRQNKASAWTAYVLGVVLVLMKERGMPFTGGTFVIESAVPAGKGVSSSAALEIAVLRALAKAFNLTFSGTEAARLAQLAENRIAGAACGLMDQLASAHGRPGFLLPILCQPDLLSQPIGIPANIRFMGLDSGVRHAVGGSSYTEVRCAASMGYTLIAREFGLGEKEIRRFRESGQRSHLPYEGYLCNIGTAEFKSRFEQLLPETIRGSEFISLAGVSIDPVTSVDPNKDYAVRTCTRHPVLERERVNRFQQLISTGNSESVSEMARLMVASHSGYGECGLGASRTDEILELAAAHYSSVIPGGRISGGGNGGTVCLLAVGKEGAEAVEDLRARLEVKYSTALHLF